MKKLNWYEDEEDGWTDTAVDSAIVWRAIYGGKEGLFHLEVYPLSLINKKFKGWEYKIIKDNKEGTGEEFDSSFETSNGDDHAPTANVVKKWAESTLEDMLEERRKEREAKKAKA